MIGPDGGLLVQPATVNTILLGLGERTDILVDFRNYTVGKEIYLTSKAYSGEAQNQQEFKIMKFAVHRKESDTFTKPSKLSVIQPLHRSLLPKHAS